jgi:hypothetical protein
MLRFRKLGARKGVGADQIGCSSRQVLASGSIGEIRPAGLLLFWVFEM